MFKVLNFRILKNANHSLFFYISQGNLSKKRNKLINSDSYSVEKYSD